MIHHGDLFDVLPTLEADSIEAAVTDPPYELGFMGKHWDASGVAFNVETWREVYRVLKPGAHLCAFGGTRGFHRMTCAIEDAGFEIRDCLSWLYGSGFPKSLDVSKAIDARAGAVREHVGFKKLNPRDTKTYLPSDGGGYHGVHSDPIGGMSITAPSTDTAKQWQGWGTALKPGWEPIILARKPFAGSVAANVLAHGTGAIHVDACRIGYQSDADFQSAKGGDSGSNSGNVFLSSKGPMRQSEKITDLGRWPANVLLDEAAAALLDAQTGELTSGNRDAGQYGRLGYQGWDRGPMPAVSGDAGGASRFYYVAKPSREERDYGCTHLRPSSAGEATDRTDGTAGLNSPRAGSGRTGGDVKFPAVEMSWVNVALERAIQTGRGNPPVKAISGFTIPDLEGSAWSMCWCGSPSTDPSHPAIRSIIATATSWITPSPTLIWSIRPHTNGCMAAALGSGLSGGNPAISAANPSPWTLSTGTSAPQDTRCMDAAARATSVSLWLRSKPDGGGHRVGVRNSHPT